MYQIYQVMPNDTIDSIANKINTTVTNLMELNGIPANSMLYPGSYIIIPKNEENIFTTYIVKNGDNLYKISKEFNTSVANLELLNGLKKDEYIYPNQELIVPSKNTSIYVTENETLNDISNKSGIDIAEIASQNPNLYVIPEQIVVYKNMKNE